VSHPLSWWCGCACDECDDWLLFGELVLCDPVSGALLTLSADLSNRDDALGLGVGGKSLDDVGVELPCEGVPPMPTTVDCPSRASVVA
jgi:hypothetical protein